MTDFPRLLDEHERAIEADCVPLDVRAPDTAAHLHTALVALTRAADLRLGWLRDLEIARAADALREAGRADLAERVESAPVLSVGPADDVLSELWRIG